MHHPRKGWDPSRCCSISLLVRLEAVEFIVFTLICLLALGWVRRFERGSQILRALRGADRKAITAAGNQSAKLVGELNLLDASLKAPLTGRRCAYYVAIVEQFDGEGWSRIIQEVQGVPFLLEDESGIALVLAEEARAALVLDVHSSSGSHAEVTRVERAFLRRHGKRKALAASPPGRRLRFSEAVLQAGEQVAVLGLCVEEPNPESVAAPIGGYRALATRMRVYGSPEFPLRISNDPSCL